MIRFLQTPGRTKKIVLSGVLLFICVSMVWYLVPSSGGDVSSTRSGVLAKVGAQEITMADLQKLVRNQPLSGPLVGQAFEYLLGEKVMLMEADRLGLRVSDDEVRDALHKGQYGQMFFPKGQYIGDEKYTSFIQENVGSTVPEFESRIKTDLLVGKLRSMVTAGADVPADEIQREFLKKNTKVKLQYAVIKADQISGEIKPTETEIKAYYDQHKAQYSSPLPEKRKARYLVIDIAKLQNEVKPTLDDVQGYYNEHREEYRAREEVKASHILIKVPAKADAKTDETARAKAEDILKQLKAGTKFEELAKKYSEDKISAEQGGSLGWFPHGTMVPEFDRVAFSTPPGQVSGIVKTEFGYHIIRVDDKHEARLKPLEEVRSQIEPQVASLKAHQEADSLANAVSKQAKAQGLDAAAAKNHLDVVNSDWFSRTDSLPGIGNSPEFTGAAFSSKEKSPPSEVGTSTGYVVFEITAIKPPAVPSYEDVRSQVEGAYKAELSSSLLYKKTQELSDRARALHDLPRAAKELGAKVSTTDLVGPEKQLPDLGSLSGSASVAFSMKPGEISTPLQAGRNGAVLAVLERQEPAQADLEKSKDEIRERLIGQKQQEMLRLYEEGLKLSMQKEGKVKVNQQELDLYTKRAGGEGGGNF